MERKEENDSLNKSYKFTNFLEAISWMKAVSFDIDELDHHPEWTNIYDTVIVKLTTHDQWNIVTEKDRQLADMLDESYEMLLGLK